MVAHQPENTQQRLARGFAVVRQLLQARFVSALLLRVALAYTTPIFSGAWEPSLRGIRVDAPPPTHRAATPAARPSITAISASLSGNASSRPPVRPNPPIGIHEMRGIAGEQHAPHAKRLRASIMHAIRIHRRRPHIRKARRK